MLVAMETIDCGAEIRINYEADQDAGMYWKDGPPPETNWRQARVRPPAAALEEPIYWHAEERWPALPCPVPSFVEDPIEWDGPTGGDARLRQIIPLLSANGKDVNESAWPLVS